ncbi:hypothetical protein MKEN_01473400 [Mycena kentingensis (nom. inval.)]|nr:hypothetical protein MKEN_01473400 [Mycena kentingensis (nom. inval.)]
MSSTPLTNLSDAVHQTLRIPLQVEQLREVAFDIPQEVDVLDLVQEICKYEELEKDSWHVIKAAFDHSPAGTLIVGKEQERHYGWAAHWKDPRIRQESDTSRASRSCYASLTTMSVWDDNWPVISLQQMYDLIVEYLEQLAEGIEARKRADEPLSRWNRKLSRTTPHLAARKALQLTRAPLPAPNAVLREPV